MRLSVSHLKVRKLYKKNLTWLRLFADKRITQSEGGKGEKLSNTETSEKRNTKLQQQRGVCSCGLARLTILDLWQPLAWQDFYLEQRVELLDSLSQFETSLNLLLYCNAMFNTNVMVFESVQKYIRDTKRF